MVKLPSHNPYSTLNFEGAPPLQLAELDHVLIKSATMPERSGVLRLVGKSLKEEMAGSAHDVAVSGKLALRRFANLATDVSDQAMLASAFEREVTSLSPDERVRSLQILTDELRKPVAARGPGRAPVFVSAGSTEEQLATGLPDHCCAALVAIPDQAPRILVSNRLALIETAHTCLIMVAAVITNRAAHLGLVQDTQRVIDGLSRAVGVAGIGCSWTFVTLRDCGVTRYGFGLQAAFATRG